MTTIKLTGQQTTIEIAPAKPQLDRYIAHTSEGIKYFGSELDALSESNMTTSSTLISECGVVLGLELNYNVLRAMTIYAGCPCENECIDHSMDKIREFREDLNKSLGF